MIATLEDLKLEQWLRRREQGKIVWKNKQKELCPISELEDTHLDNIINMLENKQKESTVIKNNTFNFY